MMQDNAFLRSATPLAMNLSLIRNQLVKLAPAHQVHSSLWAIVIFERQLVHQPQQEKRDLNGAVKETLYQSARRLQSGMASNSLPCALLMDAEPSLGW